MKIGTNDISKIYLGSAEVEAIYLGTEQVYGDIEPAEPYRFKLIDNQGNEYVDNTHAPNVFEGDINGFMSHEGISAENIVELQIGDYVTEVSIELYHINNFYNVSGITVGKNVTVIRYISNAQTSQVTGNIELQWIKLKCKSIPDISNNMEYTFDNTNCCPILVRRSLMQDYKDEWLQYNEGVCGYLSERIGTYEELPYEEQYLTFVAEADNMTVGLMYAGSNAFQYSIDGGSSWERLANNQSTFSVNSGEKILFKASGLTPTSSDGIGTLVPSANASVQGNVMSLVYDDDFEGQTTISNLHQFLGLFYQCTHITSAENLILPTTTLTQQCYRSMFYGCTSMTVAPELPATTLAANCYYNMFGNCSNLTTAPVLPATTLVTNCYTYMFSGCTSLNSITCLAENPNGTTASTSSSAYTVSWVAGVASSGTFVKSPNVNIVTRGTGWRRNEHGIPANWTYTDYVDNSGGGDDWGDQE